MYPAIVKEYRKTVLQRLDVHIRGTSRDIDKLPGDLKSSSRVSLVQSGPHDREALRNLQTRSGRFGSQEFRRGRRGIPGHKGHRPECAYPHWYLMETFLDLFGVWNPEENEVNYWGTGNDKWDLTSYQTAVEYIAAVALDPNATGFLRWPALKSNGPLTDIAEKLDRIGNAENTQT
ncbi:uncharacterized protein B0H64DRAFT_377835 [Chaetomium fimeti]|uniref:Uncharacterized protein n=1 Tax=Chaetomium fimeti TaxID=1854472 RepID=A0AAE0LN79_9PEZI|nr:hypothetical protein B0H64DRAFT_377835 [Chaetomium fimeti]